MPNPKNVRNFESTLRVGGLLTKGYGRLIGMKVINKTGSDIAADKLVAISGFDVTSKLPKIVLAQNNVADLATDVFVALGKITNGKAGNVYKGGRSGSTINTSGATTVGDPLYLDSTAGGFTSTAPTDPASRVQVVGYSTVKSSTVGQIEWDIKPVTKVSSFLDTNPDIKVLAATATFTSNTVLANLTGFSWTLVAGATYKFEVNIPATMTTNGGLDLALKYTTATAASIQLQTYASTATDNATAVSTQSTTTTDATRYFGSNTAAYTLATMKGTLVVTTGGSVAVQASQHVSNSDTTSVLLGAYAQFTRVA